MAVQILNFMPAAEVHRGEPLTPMRALAPHRTAESFYSRLSGRAWFALGTFAVHLLAIAGFMTAQRLHLTNPEAEPTIASLIESQTLPAEKPPEYMPPQEIVYALPIPQEVSYEA